MFQGMLLSVLFVRPKSIFVKNGKPFVNVFCNKTISSTSISSFEKEPSFRVQESFGKEAKLRI